MSTRLPSFLSSRGILNVTDKSFSSSFSSFVIVYGYYNKYLVERLQMMGGNVHAKAHRATVISIAGMASAGFVLCLVGGVGCNFVQVTAEPDRLLMTPLGMELKNDSSTIPEAYFGVQCMASPFYWEDDRMWRLSQIFLYIGLALGGITVVIVWTLSLFSPPTPKVWRSISIFGAGAAIFQIPIFLILESEACNMDVNRQTCRFTTGAFMNIVSVLFFISVTLWTQLVPPPDWSEELNSWRRQSVDVEDRILKLAEISIPSGEDTEDETLPSPPPAHQNRPVAPRSVSYGRLAERKQSVADEEYPEPEILREEPEDYTYPHTHAKMELHKDVVVPSILKKPDSVGAASRSQGKDTSVQHRGTQRRIRKENEPRPSTKPPIEPQESHPVSQRRGPRHDQGAMSQDCQEAEYRKRGQVSVNRDGSLLRVTFDGPSSTQSSNLPQQGKEPTHRRVKIDNNVTTIDPPPETKDHSSMQSSLGGFKNRFVRSPITEGGQRVVKFSIIYPDGTIENKQVPIQEEDDNVGKDNGLAKDHQAESKKNENQSSSMTSRDVIMAHSIIAQRTVDVQPPSVQVRPPSSNPARTEMVQSSSKDVTPLAEVFLVTHGVGDNDSVSEMTLSPLEAQADTMAILQDLRRLEK